MSSGPSRDIPIAVFVHVHYVDVWASMADWIAATIRRPFHLILTTSCSDHAISLPDTPFLVSHRILRFENRGRDIRPFLQALKTFDSFTLGLKLHTKRSIHRLDGADWGETIVRSLLPDADTVAALIEKMTGDRRLAVVAPDGMLVSTQTWMLANRRSMRRIARRLDLNRAQVDRSDAVFAAGSMFWFRKTAFARFLTVDLDDWFEPERGQVDGTTAHAVERMLSLVAETDGGIVASVEGALHSSPDMSLPTLLLETRRLADRPNAFLVPLPRFIRLLLAIPGLRKAYATLPMDLRRRLRGFRQYVQGKPKKLP